MDTREKAEKRVNSSPKLSQHYYTIMDDSWDSEEHWRWVCEETVSEIVKWAEVTEKSISEAE
jgi:hypothetical protein